MKNNFKLSSDKEAKLAKFFIYNIWPFYRRIVSKHLYKRCRRCILNERYTSINPVNGLCSLCETNEGTAFNSSSWIQMNAELNELVKETIGSHPDVRFHALMLFSGGKDSCYMLLRLSREFPALRILCLSVDNAFMSPIAVENINLSVEQAGLAHMWIRLPRSFSKTMFKFSLQRNEPGDPMGLVDFIDGELISDIARTIANRLEIPLIFMGLSSEQVEKILHLDTFQTPYEEEFKARTHVANIRLGDVFSADAARWWWQGPNPQTPPARFLFPLSTWGMSEGEIKGEVARSGFLEGAVLDPMLTNHDLILPMIITDYVRHGYFTYEPEFAEMIRYRRARRRDWINIFEVFEFASKTGKLLPTSFDNTLRALDLDRKTLKIPE